MVDYNGGLPRLINAIDGSSIMDVNARILPQVRRTHRETDIRLDGYVGHTCATI